METSGDDLEVLDAAWENAVSEPRDNERDEDRATTNLRRRLQFAIALVLAAVLLLVGGAVVGWEVRSHRKPSHETTGTSVPIENEQHIAVPSVLGLSLREAQVLLARSRLAGVAYERDPFGGTSLVVAQEPPAGTIVSAGTVVGLRTQ
jgi:hypothetical protein